MSDDPFVKDSKTGISIRFVRQFNQNQDLNGGTHPSMVDIAWQLACGDEREGVSFMDKLNDALTYMHLHIH